MEGLYRNLLINSYPSYSQTVTQVSGWDKAHQEMFLQQMQVLLDAENSIREITPASATDINQAFVEEYQKQLAKNRDLNIQRFNALAEQAVNIEQLQEAYNHSQMLANAAQESLSESNQIRYGQKLDEFRQKAAGVKQYIWASMGDDKVRPSHAALDGQVRDWTDSPAPGEESGCRCAAVPASFEAASAGEYNPEDDILYSLGLNTFGGVARLELDQYSSFLETVANLYNIDSNLIRGVMLNEAITRYGAGIPEAIVSGVRNLLFGGYGTYGPAQLGPPARDLIGFNILEVMTPQGAIIGAANFLDIQRQSLINEGIKNPTNAQIASRYNMGSWNDYNQPTKYGIRVEYLINRFYSNK